MKTASCLLAVLSMSVLGVSAWAAGTPRITFRDTFDVSAQSNDINFENTAGRQSGTAAPLTYLENTGGATDPLTQVGAADAPGWLRLEVPPPGYVAVSPNHNFTEGGNFTIEFDLDAGLNDPGGTSGDWACIVFGASSPLMFVNASDGMGILFRNNGAIQVFDGGTDTGGGAALPLGQIHVRIEVETPNFQGNSPATVRMFVNDIQVQLASGSMEYIKPTGFRGNYLTLGGGAWGGTWVHVFDNFTVTATPCIRPSIHLVKSYPGQTNQTVTVFIPEDLTQTAPVEVVVTSQNPAVAEPLGATDGRLVLQFPVGVTRRDLGVAAKRRGSTVLELSSTAEACIGGSVEVVVGPSLVANPSFEQNYNPTWPHYGPIDGWTQIPGGNTGVNEADGPFHDNGVIPDRRRIGFNQGGGGISQMISGLIPGQQYWLQFRYNKRQGGTMGLTTRFAGAVIDTIPSITPVGGTNPYHYRQVVFTPASDSGLLEFLTMPGGDATVLLDAVTLVPRGTNQVPLWNPSFEASGDVPSPGIISPAPISGWVGVGTYGVNRCGQDFADTGVNPDQERVAFIRGYGSALSQVVSNLVVGQEYKIILAVSARAFEFPGLRLSMGGEVLFEDTIFPVEPGEPYQWLTNSWVATAPVAELKLEQFDDLGGTLLVDDVQIIGLALPPCQTEVSVQVFDLFQGQPTATNVVTVSLPRYVVATQAVDVIVISADSSIAVPTGAAGDTLVLHLPAGLTNSVSFGITAFRSGVVTFLVTNSIGCPGATFTVRNRASFVLNPSFEDNSTDNWPGYFDIEAWTETGGCGLNPITVEHPNGRSPFADNGAIPDRSQVAFIQGQAGLAQTLYGLDTNKQYWLQVWINARNCCGDFPSAAARFNGVELASAPVVPPVGGANPYYFVSLPFTPNAPTGALEILSGPTAANGDRTLLVDAVTLVQRDPSDVVIANPSFEASGVPPWPGYIAPAPMAGWTGVGGYGVNVSGAGPFADNGATPDQDNVAFLQGPGSALSQTISNLTEGQTYRLSFAYNARSGNSPRLVVTLDGNTVLDEVVLPVGGSAPYRAADIPFTATGPAVVLTFTQAAEGDQTVLLDNVRILAGPPYRPRLKIAWLPDQQAVRISWPVVAGPAWTLQVSTALPGNFVDAGLPVTVEGDEYVAYDFAGSGAAFYRLAK
jgi:hypothetical protein